MAHRGLVGIALNCYVRCHYEVRCVPCRPGATPALAPAASSSGSSSDHLGAQTELELELELERERERERERELGLNGLLTDRMVLRQGLDFEHIDRRPSNRALA